jgi:hypothetical protein
MWSLLSNFWGKSSNAMSKVSMSKCRYFVTIVATMATFTSEWNKNPLLFPSAESFGGYIQQLGGFLDR